MGKDKYLYIYIYIYIYIHIYIYIYIYIYIFINIISFSVLLLSFFCKHFNHLILVAMLHVSIALCFM